MSSVTAQLISRATELTLDDDVDLGEEVALFNLEELEHSVAKCLNLRNRYWDERVRKDAWCGAHLLEAGIERNVPNKRLSDRSRTANAVRSSECQIG